MSDIGNCKLTKIIQLGNNGYLIELWIDENTVHDVIISESVQINLSSNE